MGARTLARSRALLRGLVVSGVLLAGSAACSTPRYVHEPIAYSGVKLRSAAIVLELIDARVAAPSLVPREGRELALPESFEAEARQRLSTLVGGQGPELRIVTRVARADELELVDARGEMTRVLVELGFDVYVKDGPMLRKAEAQSFSDIPRDEATPEEIELVLRATAANAFDRYWASADSVNGLNRELSAYEKRHGVAAGQ